MSGYCDFCQIWHSASCCHPGRIRLIALEEQVRELRCIIEITIRQMRENGLIKSATVVEKALSETRRHDERKTITTI